MEGERGRGERGEKGGRGRRERGEERGVVMGVVIQRDPEIYSHVNSAFSI